jgi:hypothetical protein
MVIGDELQKVIALEIKTNFINEAEADSPGNI